MVARQKGENEECGAQRAVQSDAYRYTELAEPHCKLPADKDCLHSKAFAQQGRNQATDELENAYEGGSGARADRETTAVGRVIAQLLEQRGRVDANQVDA